MAETRRYLPDCAVKHCTDERHTSNGDYCADHQDADVRACHVCKEPVLVDGDHAIERWGDVLCRGCADEPVHFRAECTNQFCGWGYELEGREFDRGHVEQLVRSEANNHVTRKRVFEDDPMHETEVEEVRE